MIKRDQAFQVLARHFPDGIVVPVFQAAFDWMAIRPHPLNYLCTGAMDKHPHTLLVWRSAVRSTRSLSLTATVVY